MDRIAKFKRQRRLLTLAALPFLPVIFGWWLVQRLQKRRARERALRVFSHFHGNGATEVASWFEASTKNLEDRLEKGVLHSEAEKVRAIEPLVPLYSPDMQILMHPFGDKAIIHKINSILELQDLVERKRFDTVVVASSDSDSRALQMVLKRFERDGGRMLLVDTSEKGSVCVDHKVLAFQSSVAAIKLLSKEDKEHVLFEFIRSLHPARVILADSDMMWSVVSVYGRALAASSELSAFFSASEANRFTQRYFYRFIDILRYVYVHDEASREKLISRFVLADKYASMIKPLDSAAADDHCRRTSALEVIGGIDEPVRHDFPDLDISVIVTAHNETVVTGPTMIAANAAVATAIDDGYSVEKIVALDAATDATRCCFTNPTYSDWKVVELKERDVGRARNRIVRMCRGRYVAFIDADDLVSDNWLSSGAKVLDSASEAGDRVIVHPEVNWVFDGERYILPTIPQEWPIFSPALFYFGNYYDALSLAPREAHLSIPYVSRDIPNGLSYQDYQFAIESIEQGWKHRIASDTIIFKRRRDSSLVTESRERKSVIRRLEAMAIDKVLELGKDTSRSKRPEPR